MCNYVTITAGSSPDPAQRLNFPGQPRFWGFPAPAPFRQPSRPKICPERRCPEPEFVRNLRCAEILVSTIGEPQIRPKIRPAPKSDLPKLAPILSGKVEVQVKLPFSHTYRAFREKKRLENDKLKLLYLAERRKRGGNAVFAVLGCISLHYLGFGAPGESKNVE